MMSSSEQNEPVRITIDATNLLPFLGAVQQGLVQTKGAIADMQGQLLRMSSLVERLEARTQDSLRQLRGEREGNGDRQAESPGDAPPDAD